MTCLPVKPSSVTPNRRLLSCSTPWCGYHRIHHNLWLCLFAWAGVWLEDQTEVVHLGHLRISVKSHPMLKKVSAIIEAFFKKRAVLTLCYLFHFVKESMLLVKDKADREGTVSKTDTIDRIHSQKLCWQVWEAHLQQHEWSKTIFKITSLPSPFSSPNISLSNHTLYLQVRAVRRKLPFIASADMRMKFPQSDTFIRPLTVLTFCDFCPSLQYKHI